MRFDVIALFPELIEPSLTLGVARRAYGRGGVVARLWPLRDFAQGAYRRVDDRPYGGGAGMVMMVEPLARALQAVRADRREDGGGAGGAAPVISFSPAGRRLDQDIVRELGEGPGAILVCGRYEGIDQRFIDAHVDWELSLGDYVISGGELAAAVVLDAVVRLKEGVLNDPRSHEQDSFSDGLLEGPHYTRPERWAGGSVPRDVPAVLLSGDHAAIARYRRHEALRRTARARPDLIERARAAGRLSSEDEAFLDAL